MTLSDLPAFPMAPIDHPALPHPIAIARIELLHYDGSYVVRAFDQDGMAGVFYSSKRLECVHPLLIHKMFPEVIGRDARDLPQLLHDLCRHASNYKYSGITLGVCLAAVEGALLDLLGQLAACSVPRLLGTPLRSRIPVYLSSLRRDTSPEEEIDWLSARLADTGAQAVKVKIGGRLSQNADAAPGRSERLVTLARQAWPELRLFVDANGSYDAPEAIRIGRWLQDQGVALFEEPCPFDDFVAIRRVAEALDLPVAGGEQDHSLPLWHWHFHYGTFDVAQPDIAYAGGFLRTLAIGRLAAAVGIPLTPHAPQFGPAALLAPQLVSLLETPFAFHECRAEPHPQRHWIQPTPLVQDGHLPVLDGPGFGITFDRDALNAAPCLGCAGHRP